MLFNSAIFLLVFLPTVLVGHYLLTRWSSALTVCWLLFASLFFYAWWHPPFLLILVSSIVVNFAIGRRIEMASSHRSAWLVAGLTANIGALVYFKYSNFLVDSLNASLSADISWSHVLLPIGISFFTFQQIAFLVDTYHYGSIKRSFASYALFVSFFPHSIAGPIVNPREMIPQFGLDRPDRWADFAEGLSLFLIGLIKKMVVADTFARASTSIFDAAAIGVSPTFFEAWTATLCYTLQIYFDFSGYSDMAIGLARMFGLDLPINFMSPYKARSIIEFWRRWHITLSRFLRDYLYIPLGGSRRGKSRQKFNIMVTMLLGGLWHGANWTFLIWGGLQGVFLLINHAWQQIAAVERLRHSRVWKFVCVVLTMGCIIFAWVPFRAADVQTTVRMWQGMVGLNGVIFPERIAGWVPSLHLPAGPLNSVSIVLSLFLLCGFAVAMLAPNTHELMRRAKLGTPTKGYETTYLQGDGALVWQTKPWVAILFGAMIVVVILKLNDISEFIYFQF